MPYSGQLRAKPHPLRPIADINTTPLIDVMLVLLIMMIITIPLPPHSLEVDLPQDGPPPPYPINQKINKVVVTAQGRMLWNGNEVDRTQLSAQVAATTRLADEPQLQFEPEARAGYAESAEAINLIKDAGATKFAFVGNHQYRRFERDR